MREVFRTFLLVNGLAENNLKASHTAAAAALFEPLAFDACLPGRAGTAAYCSPTTTTSKLPGLIPG